MNPELRCHRVTVNMNKMEADALDKLLCHCRRNVSKCGYSAARKVLDAWYKALDEYERAKTGKL